MERKSKKTVPRRALLITGGGLSVSRDFYLFLGGNSPQLAL